MKQQIIVSGTGGQGILFLTRFFAEAAMLMHLEVITSEIHGMAMRGGTVMSHVKVGPFKSPLVRMGHADIGLILNKQNLELHRGFVKPDGSVFVNADSRGDYFSIDASGLALSAGSPALTNLILLGFVMKRGVIFCGNDIARKVLNKLSPAAQLDLNLRAFDMGLHSR
ncbi:MAG: 2-oxoacid:acceptor oxidoreductase family protein [Syntrophales bacterium LBB04]|nr:2-oxoacid:acceptor oxidoreductase family protein [Syntrophales bacterium LBB04]